MYQSLRTLNTTEFKEEFADLKTGIELVLTKEGMILSVNEKGREFFIENSSFYDYVKSNFKNRAGCFISCISNNERCEDVTLVHASQNEEVYIQYSGMMSNDYILLTGRKISDPAFSMETSELLQQFEHAAVIVNAQLEIQKYNKAFVPYVEISDYEGSNPVISKNIHVLTEGNKGLAVAPKLVEEVLEKEKTLEMELKNDQAEEWFYLKGLYLKETHCVLLMIYDLTYEKKYHHLLTFQDQMESVSYLSAGVAHELRNPLSVIKGFLQLSSLTDSFHKYSDTILSEAERMNEIIDNFLSVARKKAKKEWKTPNCLLDSVIDIIRSECLMQGVHFEYQVEPAEGKIEVNESSFKQIILNALRNSMEAFPNDRKGNMFSLDSYSKDDHLIICLSDNGKGIPSHVLNNIGKPFFTTKEKGTGVGIPLCKKIMEEHDGTFDIESNDGKGTVITLSFPLNQQE
ncbi:two-component sensor histidine kinase [Salibacterium salarium]|uniref:histidine kinase n=1 Tax=Salibacterium salarium TaxID=284579 RepID=A0A3R9QHS7_9BACI|nr:ATP-binding protein [Salibacterium salarium]RSL30914.1 two-component sensor histidine kinase [Salibacterium salarium]